LHTGTLHRRVVVEQEVLGRTFTREARGLLVIGDWLPVRVTTQ
jgi:hypothetical protein